MKKYLLAVMAACAVFTTAANAASFQANPGRCNDGDPNCWMVTIEGKINPGDDEVFTRVTKKVPDVSDDVRVVVVLESPGGNFDAGMSIARQVRDKRYSTGANKLCTSICAVIWLSGNGCFYLKESAIGFHGVFTHYVDKNGNHVKGTPYWVPSGSNAVLGAWLAELGVPMSTIELFTSPNADSMYWLKTKNLKALGINATRLGDN